MRSAMAAYDEPQVAVPATAPGRGTSSRRGRPRVFAVVPAHNEEAGIAAAVASLWAQSVRPDSVIVVADNCTDRTASLAAEAGAVVIETVANQDKKAGALNQALDLLLPALVDADRVLCMDADSTLGPEFIEVALADLHGQVGAVGGNFYGAVNTGWLRRMQCNEYTRFARDTARKDAKAWVLTGTGAVFRVDVLREVVAARSAGRLPGAGYVYDATVLTEDNELTLAIKHLGYRCLSPQGCVVMTDVMPTWRELWRQRLRWKRGAMENLLQYGLTRVTLPYYAQHLLMFFGLAFFALYLGLCAATMVSFGGIAMHWVWLLPTAIFALERAVTVRANGWRNVLLAASLVPEWTYEIFMQACLLRASRDIVRGSARHW